MADFLKQDALNQAREAFAAFNASAPSILRIEWDAGWDAFSADELYDLRDEFRAMLVALSA
jgi:hypothetical protein